MGEKLQKTVTDKISIKTMQNKNTQKRVKDISANLMKYENTGSVAVFAYRQK